MKIFLQRTNLNFRRLITRSIIAAFISTIALLSQVSFAATHSVHDFNDHSSSESGTISQEAAANIPTDFSIRFKLGGDTRRSGSSFFYKKRLGRSNTHRDRRFNNNLRSYSSYGRPIYRDHRGQSKRSFGFVDRYNRYRR